MCFSLNFSECQDVDSHYDDYRQGHDSWVTLKAYMLMFEQGRKNKQITVTGFHLPTVQL
jgi:hypothetical protein